MFNEHTYAVDNATKTGKFISTKPRTSRKYKMLRYNAYTEKQHIIGTRFKLKMPINCPGIIISLLHRLVTTFTRRTE
jgi:hypothetical protein